MVLCIYYTILLNWNFWLNKRNDSIIICIGVGGIGVVGFTCEGRHDSIDFLPVHQTITVSVWIGGICEVSVFPFRVERILDQWPEDYFRNRQWFYPKEAITAVDNSELKDIIKHFVDNKKTL